MNIVLGIVQTLLALHTAMGAAWKFSNPAEASVPSLAAIPHSVWLGLSVVEIVASLVLIVALFAKPLARFVPMAALFIAAEMILFVGVHVASGESNYSPVIYWLVVALVSALLAAGRLARARKT